LNNIIEQDHRFIKKRNRGESGSHRIHKIFNRWNIDPRRSTIKKTRRSLLIGWLPRKGEAVALVLNNLRKKVPNIPVGERGRGADE
jgi:hypothetical protein